VPGNCSLTLAVNSSKVENTLTRPSGPRKKSSVPVMTAITHIHRVRLGVGATTYSSRMTLPAYTVTRKPVKYTRIRVHAPDGRVTVTAPRHVSEREIAQFVTQKAAWIAKHQARIAAAPPPPEADPVPEHLRPVLYARIGPLMDYWTQRMGLEPPTYAVRRMKTRWGTCNTQRRHVTFALELARRDDELLEYVVVHELAHLFEHNHGPRFKAIMTRYLPNWLELRARLNGRY